VGARGKREIEGEMCREVMMWIISVKNFVSQGEQVKKKVNQIVHRPANIHFSIEFEVMPYVFIFIS
jgi:hypothetical protein